MQPLSPDQVEQWMSFYYQHPQPDRVPEAIASLSAAGYFKNEQTIEPIICFLSLIFRANSDRLATWLPALQSLPEDEQPVGIYALWYSNTPAAHHYLAQLAKVADPATQELITALQHESPPEIEQIPLSSSGVLDLLWAAFMATGEAKYVLPILTALSEVEATDPDRQLVGETAQWSLQTNASKHPKVRAICLEQMATQPEPIARILQTIVAARGPEN